MHTYKRRTFNKKPKPSFKRELSNAEQAEQFVGYDTWSSLSSKEKDDVMSELGISMSNGGKVKTLTPNNYKNKSPKSVWESWNMTQREHFLKDHFSDYTTRLASVLEYDSLSSQPIGRDIQAKLAEHVQSGQYSDGGEVAEKYVISFKIDGKEKKKEFTDKDKMDSFLEMMKEDEPDFKYKVEEDKPKPEPKKSLFGMAKAAAPKAASKKEKESIQVDGISTEISRYEELKTIINNAKAEQELIGGNLKAKGVEAYLEAYKTKGYNPDTFNLADGDEKIMFIVMDKYKKVEPEKAAILEQFDGLLETTTTYSFNPTVLDRVGEIVSRIIMESKLLSDDDKANLVIEETTVVVKKGTVDRLLSYDNPEEIFELVQPIIALK